MKQEKFDFWLFIAQGFYSGRLPKMPGTWGTLVAIPLFIILSSLPLTYNVIISIIITLFGCWLCGYACKKLNVHDDPSIVWDEIAGYLWTMLAIPASWEFIVLGFLLFRLFDIWKPWPISWANREVKGGTGVMLDDLMAAVPAWIILQVLIYYGVIPLTNGI